MGGGGSDSAPLPSFRAGVVLMDRGVNAFERRFRINLIDLTSIGFHQFRPTEWLPTALERPFNMNDYYQVSAAPFSLRTESKLEENYGNLALPNQSQ